MSDKLEYTVDGEPVSWTGLIRRAKESGYYRDDCFYTTSGAAAYLRDQGSTVEHNTEE